MPGLKPGRARKEYHRGLSASAGGYQDRRYERGIRGHEGVCRLVLRCSYQELAVFVKGLGVCLCRLRGIVAVEKSQKELELPRGKPAGKKIPAPSTLDSLRSLSTIFG